MQKKQPFKKCFLIEAVSLITAYRGVQKKVISIFGALPLEL